MMNDILNTDINSVTKTITDLATTYGLKLISAIAVLLIGLWIARIISRAAVKMMRKAQVNESLIPFLKTLISATLKTLVIISVLGMAGIQMTSFIAVLGAAGLAVGLALQGTLQNFAGGVIILLFKPYKVGDVIETQGYIGSVREIQIFTTVLSTADNKTIIIPNSPIATGSLTNYTMQPTRRVDMTFGIGYSDDIDKAREVIMKIIEGDDRIQKEPAPAIRVSELGDSSVNFATRVWTESGEYWNVFFDMNEAVKKAFDREGISIPFPQRDVHVYNH
jgi:small conductance mechanosensitive channel